MAKSNFEQKVGSRKRLWPASCPGVEKKSGDSEKRDGHQVKKSKLFNLSGLLDFLDRPGSFFSTSLDQSQDDSSEGLS